MFYSERVRFFFFLIFKVVNIKIRKAEEQSLRGKTTGGLRAGRCKTEKGRQLFPLAKKQSEEQKTKVNYRNQ